MCVCVCVCVCLCVCVCVCVFCVRVRLCVSQKEGKKSLIISINNLLKTFYLFYLRAIIFHS